jgi:curved DNA-binding protein CbpA
MEHTGRSHDDPYQVLGLGAGASRREIGRAYRQAAQRVHPDTQPHDPAAAARFQALTDAYELLTDPVRRAGYDRSHPTSEPAGQRPPDPGPARRRGPGSWPGPPGHQPIWAGPVLIEPPAPSRAAEGHAAERQAAERQAAERRAAERRPASGRATGGQTTEEQTAEEHATEEQTAEEHAVEGQAAEGQAAEGQAAQGRATGQYRRGPEATAWVDPPVVLGGSAAGVWSRGW